MARILLVDDDEVVRGLVRSCLRARGHDVTLASNGAQALLLARERPPDIVVTDIFMPQVSGIDLCHSIRSTPELKDIYVVLITGKDATETEMAALEAGADDFITKPLRREEFVTRVEIGLRVRGFQAEIRGLRESNAGVLAVVEGAVGQLARLRQRLEVSPVPDIAGKLGEIARTIAELTDRARPAAAVPGGQPNPSILDDPSGGVPGDQGKPGAKEIPGSGASPGELAGPEVKGKQEG